MKVFQACSEVVKVDVAAFFSPEFVWFSVRFSGGKTASERREGFKQLNDKGEKKSQNEGRRKIEAIK